MLQPAAVSYAKDQPHILLRSIRTTVLILLTNLVIFRIAAIFVSYLQKAGIKDTDPSDTLS